MALAEFLEAFKKDFKFSCVGPRIHFQTISLQFALNRSIHLKKYLCNIKNTACEGK